MRAAILAGIILLGACQDLTSLTPDRVPPPDRQLVQEGTLEDPTDPCGALDVEAPRRLSATPGSSDGVRMAVLPRAGGETWVGVAWLEHGSDDPPSTANVAVQVLLDDGVAFGDTLLLDAESPESVDIAARVGTEQFVVASGDGEMGSRLTTITRVQDPQQSGFREMSIALPRVERPTVAFAQDRGFVIGLEPGPGARRAIAMGSVTIGARAIEVQTTDLPGLQATDVTLSTNGGQTWIAWNDGSEVLGAPLRETSQDGWEVADGTALSTYQSFPLRRAQGTTDLAVAATVATTIEVLRLEETEWKPLGAITDELDRVEGLAATRGESGARWAIAHTWSPGDGSPLEVRIERFRTNKPVCNTPGECVRVTTDLQVSSEPEIVAVDSGYLIAWSDAIDGQTDVFVTRALCHSTTTPTD